MSARDDHQALFARAMDPATAAAHADMDETGKWGAENCKRRLVAGELDAGIDEDRRYFIAAETEACRQPRPEIRANSQPVEQVHAFECKHGLTSCPLASGCDCRPVVAEPCTELGAEATQPRRARLGPLGSVGRWVLGHQVHIIFAVYLAALYLIGHSMGAGA